MGPTWFTEFASMEEKTLEVELGGTKLSCTVELIDFKEPI